MTRLYVALAMGMLLGAGCGPGLMNQPGVPGLDVGGPSGATWHLRFLDPLTITVTGAAAMPEVSQLPMAGGNFQVGQVTVALSSLCARPDVVCPQSVFPLDVTLTQSDPMLHMLRVQVNPKGPLALLPQPTLLGNVDSVDMFAVLLGAGVAGMGTCGLLDFSIASGSITPDPQNASRGIALDGTITVNYAGGCIVQGNTMGATGAGIAVKLQIPFSGTRS